MTLRCLGDVGMFWRYSGCLGGVVFWKCLTCSGNVEDFLEVLVCSEGVWGVLEVFTTFWSCLGWSEGVLMCSEVEAFGMF